MICQLTTVGYATMNAGWSASSFKPYHKAEAMQHSSDRRCMLELLEESGEYNIGAQFRVDCTVLARHHDHDQIHIGENVEHLRKMISCPAFFNVLGHIKAVWRFYLRDQYKDNRFDGLLFDPYGQCRSVALARIVAHCLTIEGVQVLNVNHLSKNKWQCQCCDGECLHCTSIPMSNEKAAVLDSAFDIWQRV